MKRRPVFANLPILPTLIVAAAVAVMIGLGIWQIGRAGEKARMLSALEAGSGLPPVDLNSWRPSAAEPLSALAYRRAQIHCPAQATAPELQGGRSRDGRGGYVQVSGCGPALDGRLRIVIGWAAMPHQDPPLWAGGLISGRLGGVKDGQPIRLVSDTAPPPLAPAAPARLEDIANNHIAYAGQWFFFAAAAAIIYLLALRRRRSDLRPRPTDPKGPVT